MKSSRRRRFFLRVLSLSVGLLVAALMAEGFVLVTVGEQAKFPRRVVAAPWGLRYNEPGATYRHKSRDGTWYFRINQQGMRADRDYPHAKPEGVRRVLVLGDSFAIGYEVDVEQSFAKVLERQLRTKQLNVEVLNAGVSGYSMAEALLYLERELIKYQPDVVVSSFYQNDLDDNIRADLLRLEGDALVAGRESYVPAGRLGDFLNTSLVFNVLSERSNAFAFAKEQLTYVVKNAMEGRNQLQSETPASDDAAETKKREEQEIYERRLLAAIVNRMYEFLHARNIPLVILSIPHKTEFRERFPCDLVDFTRPDLEFVSGEKTLRPLAATHTLYNQFSLNHWTPIAHQAAGKALANASVWDRFYRGSPTTSQN